MKAINFRAVSIVKYEAGIVDWVKEELEVMDRKTRKLMTIYRALHAQADVDRLYFKKGSLSNDNGDGNGNVISKYKFALF